jgi:hypothetical protein
MFVFLVLHKNDLIKICLSFEDLSENKIPWSQVDWWKFCIHLRSLNIHRFGMAEATWLKIMELRTSSIKWSPY